MTRHFNFGYDGYITVGCIFYYIFYFFLCVKATITNAIVSFSGITSDGRTISPTANLSKLWIFFYFNPPSLVICQMPMEIIHFMQGEVIDIFFYKTYRKKMATNIEMHTTISKA